MSISAALRELLVKRDKNRCAYCLTTEENCGLRMHVDHIVPESAGGATTVDNLCLICFSCNTYKGVQQTGVDPTNGETVHLFHPINQQWSEHFVWDESKTQVLGLTPCGRATILALRMNNPIIIAARRRWVGAGWHPPA